MSDYNKVKNIIESLGGKSNIKDYFYCATRSRFNLNDYSIIDTEKLKSQPSIISVVKASGQCQLVIGSNLESVYQLVESYLDKNYAKKKITHLLRLKNV